ncbi:MAG: hypothetical protein V4819_07325 [Verrucomicrobiota bacterium]
MKRAVIAVLSFLMASIASAEVFVLTKGAGPPERDRPRGMDGMREIFDGVENSDVWLNTDKGDILWQYRAWKDKAGRFTIGWKLEEGRIVEVYYSKGTPKWDGPKMTPMKWPVSNSISIDLESGALVDTKPAEQAVAPNRSLSPSQKSTSSVRGSED